MEKSTTEIDTVSSQMKVLSIGDKEEDSIGKIQPLEYNTEADFKSQLCYILLGSRKPIEVVDNWDLIGRFGASADEGNKKPKSYAFYYHKDCSWPPKSIIDGPVLCGREAMDEVKKRLCEENWISEYEISTPLKANLDDCYNNPYQFIQNTVSDVYDAEQKRLINYLRFLRTERVKPKK